MFEFGKRKINVQIVIGNISMLKKTLGKNNRSKRA